MIRFLENRFDSISNRKMKSNRLIRFRTESFRDVCESRTSHVSINRFAFCSDLLLEFFFMYEDEFEKKNAIFLFIELCESYDASNKRQTRDELVVMTRKAKEDEMSSLNMSFT